MLDSILPLLPPPPPEEGGLHVDEPPLLILGQGSHHAVEDVLDPGTLNVIPVSVVILVNSLEPADILDRGQG